MRLSRIALLLWLAIHPAFAQVRFHFGDNPAWAKPEFNDAGWPTYSPDGFLDSKTSEPVWTRSHVPMPLDSGAETAILWPADCGNVVSPAELFINGVRVAKLGQFTPPDAPALPSTCLFLVPAGLARPGEILTIAIHTLYSSRTPLQVVAGRRDVLFERALRLRAQHRVGWSIELARGVFLLLLGIALLIVWKAARGGSPLLVFGAWLIVEGAFSGADIVFRLVPDSMTTRGAAVLYAPLTILEVGLILNFVWSFYRLRARWIYYSGQALNVGGAVLYGAIAWFQAPAGPWAVPAKIALTMFPLILLVIGFLGLRRRSDERLVGIGLVAVAFCLLVSVLPPPFNLPGEFSAGPFTIYLETVGLTAFAVGVSILLWRRAWSNWRENERLNGEVAAAREIQRRLIPLEPPQIAGYRLTAAFIPAEQVGGDFYHVIEAGSMSALVVIGDVSGKGLRAAMVVASIVGALRNEFSRSPSEVLAHLNDALVGQLGSGFVTCCAASLQADGTLVVANAGHIPPWLNQSEVDLPGGLPLGLVPGSEYPETCLALSPGDRLAFVSDGIVEARSKTGELFGFARTATIAGSDAAEIAAAACAFGQDDDISVITIERTEAAHAA